MNRRGAGGLGGDFFCLGGGDGNEVERNFDFVFHLEGAAGDGDELNSVVGLAESASPVKLRAAMVGLWPKLVRNPPAVTCTARRLGLGSMR